jgi:hypothetical protein
MKGIIGVLNRVFLDTDIARIGSISTTFLRTISSASMNMSVGFLRLSLSSVSDGFFTRLTDSKILHLIGIKKPPKGLTQ